MNEVSGRAVAFLIQIARKAGVDPLRLVSDLVLPSDPQTFCRRPQALDWQTFATLLERLAQALGGPEALYDVAWEDTTPPSASAFRRVGRSMARPADLYWFGVRWVGPTLFPAVAGELIELPDGTLQQTLTIEEGLRGAPALFHAIHGALERLPESWGHARSEVDANITPHRAVYRIRPSDTRRGWIHRFQRLFHRRSAYRSVLNELVDQQTALTENYRSLRDAHSRIQDQAEALTRINQIGRDLSRYIDLDRLADVLVETLVRDVGVSGAELWLVSPESVQIDRARLFRQRGACFGEATYSFPLMAGGREVGTLVVWFPATSDAEASASPESEFLDRLLPWIAIALDNARTYEAIRSHAEELEQRVRERTASLVSANHHLVREIEERKRATEALLESETQRRASERLASVGTLAAGIAHEINNPIGAILAAAQFAQVLQNHDEDASQLADSLKDIEREAKRCGGIVRSVLQFARDEQTDKWDCRLDEILRRAARLAHADRLRARSDVRLVLPEDPVWVHVNPIQIEQAVVNLVRNAIEAGGEQVRISLDRVPSESLALIQVDDDGPGLPEEQRARIFEPFFTTRREAGGTGLGLSVVHGIASEHLGSLRVDASERGGLAVLLELPTIPAPARAIDEKPDRTG